MSKRKDLETLLSLGDNNEAISAWASYQKERGGDFLVFRTTFRLIALVLISLIIFLTVTVSINSLKEPACLDGQVKVTNAENDSYYCGLVQYTIVKPPDSL